MITIDDHSCSYHCDRPECIKAQRDLMREELKRIQSAKMPEPVAYGVVDAEMGIVITFSHVSMCHDHINEAINEHNFEDAKTWTVRPLYGPELLAYAQRKDVEARNLWEIADGASDRAESLERDKAALIAENKGLRKALKNLATAAENIGGEHVTGWQALIDACVTAEQVLLGAKTRNAAIDNAMAEGRGK